jgi:hypothetical protein
MHAIIGVLLKNVFLLGPSFEREPPFRQEAEEQPLLEDDARKRLETD